MQCFVQSSTRTHVPLDKFEQSQLCHFNLSVLRIFISWFVYLYVEYHRSQVQIPWNCVMSHPEPPSSIYLLMCLYLIIAIHHYQYTGHHHPLCVVIPYSSTGFPELSLLAMVLIISTLFGFLAWLL